MYTCRLLPAIGFLLLSGCSAPLVSPAMDAPPAVSVMGPDETPPWAAPPIDRAVTVLDGRTGEVMSFSDMLDALAGADAVFLGETHIDETTHRVEFEVYNGLLDRREGNVVLAMEMFERDVQPVLNAYLAGEIDEADFLESARPWGQYRSAYRPMIERAREVGRPVIASNFPRPLTRRVAMEGLSILDSLPGDTRSHAPAEIHPNTPEYWRRVDNAIRGHIGMMPKRPASDQRLTSTQTLWDNSMGESCALALDANPGSMVLHVNGGFHSAYWGGTVRQFSLRKPDARVLTVDIRSTRNPSVAQLGGAPTADFVVMAEARATDRYEETLSVALDRALDYRFHLPKNASDEQPVPLLIWLGDDGLTSRDGMDLWRDRLGDDAAIVVIEPPYRARFGDLSEGGRWFWSDSFAEDVGSVIGASQRIWAYLMRYHPIDPDRVCVAGEGTGATIAAAIAMLGDRMDHQAVSLEPKQYAKLKDYPLPLPEYRDESERAVTLMVTGSAEDESWWRDELTAHREIGLPGSFVMNEGTAAGRDGRQESTLRDALGLPASEAQSDGLPAYIVVPADTPRAWHWSRLYALRHTAATGQPVALVDSGSETARDTSAAEITIAVDPSTIGHAIPRCPGPFGGTTVLVLPESMSDADRQAWIDLEERDPLNATSRFHRMTIALTEADAGERSIRSALNALEARGRKNVLIVPAEFCADAATMHALERQTRGIADRMTISWLPGLGGEELPVASEPIVMETGVVGHALHVVLDPATNHLAVDDTITLPASARRAGAEFTLNSALEITKSEPEVKKIEVTGDETGDGDARYALLAAPANGVLRLTYDGAFDFGLSDQKEEYSRGFRETRGTLGPEGVYLDGGSAWVARFGDEMVRFTVEIEAPGNWHVISQGNGSSDAGSGDDRIARWDSAADLEQVYLVGGPLTVEREMAGSVEVLVYLHEMDEALSQKYLDTTAQYLEMYRRLIGPYPYGKFALVENFWETGYGMPSFTLLGERVIRFPFILHSSYPHEILHNWWGNSVFVDYESGNWCEGLTAYMADHLIKEQRGGGIEYRRTALQKYRDYVQEGRDFPLSEFRSRHSAATEAVGYGKALMTFHMLRRRVGDDAFRAAMTKFYQDYRGVRASFDDIRTTFESVTGDDLSPFFDQWITRSGAPNLVVRDVQVADPESTASGASVYTVTGTIEQVQSDEPFALEVPIVIATESGQKTFIVEMDERTSSFTLAVDSRPGVLAVDPSFDIFRQLDPLETPSSIGQIFGEPEILAVVPSGDDANGYIELMEGWRTDDHIIEIVRDDEIDALPSDRAIWILGRTNRFAGDFLAFDPGAQPAAADGAVMLGSDRVPVAERTIVVIRPHPDNPEKAIGWITVEPATALPGLARKLPHYGKYSYVAFEGDAPTNNVKGQWQATGSPLVIDLDADEAIVLSPEERAALAEFPSAQEATSQPSDK